MRESWFANGLGAVVVATTVLVGADASAAPSLKLAAQPTQAEAGENILVELTAMSGPDESLASQPRLSIPPGLTIVSGPSVGSRSFIHFGGGGMTRQQGLSVQWTLQAGKPGSYRIEASVAWQGKRLSSAKALQVTPQGSTPRRRNRSPFDVFGFPQFDDDLFAQQDDLLRRMQEEQAPPTDPGLSMAVAPAPDIFLRAMLDKDRAVIGEQVTLSIYEYRRVSHAQIFGDKESDAPDFVRKPLRDPSEQEPSKYAEVGGETWTVDLRAKTALFPIRAGNLSISPTAYQYVLPGRRNRIPRATSPLTVAVTEPPTAGRPLGYQLGDVGRFELTGEVTPRRTDFGGAVSVRLTVTGWGNHPTRLIVPQSSRAQWLDPTTRDDIETRESRLEGTRTFAYIVNLRDSGSVSLGEAKLPYYDPVKKAYETVTVDLGTVEVQPGSAPPAGSTEQPKKDRFSEVPGAITLRSGYAPPAQPITESRWYWILVAIGPLLGLAGQFAGGLHARLGKLLGSWRMSKKKTARSAISEARTLLQAGKAANAASALERAIHDAVEASTGIICRGLVRSEMSQALEASGIEDKRIRDLVEALETCESLRFNPSFDPSAASMLLDQVDELVKHLMGQKGKRP